MCGQTRAVVLVTWFVPLPAVRSGLLHLADALSFHGDLEVANSTARAVIATLRSGEKCPVEPELISKGTVPSPSAPRGVSGGWGSVCLREPQALGLLHSASSSCVP